MGLEDRDYYRDDYAKKNGMRYSATKGTYSAAQQPRVSEPVHEQREPKKKATFMDKFLWVMGLVLGTCVYFGYFRADFLRWLSN
ncbi:hypothetical protein [Comamonas sp. HJ-2]